MHHTEGVFQGFDGLKLYYQRWLPNTQLQAIVVVVHGLGGHSELFKNGVRCLVPQGYGVYAMDLRGHGRSPGLRGHIQQWQEFREDLRAFLQFVCAQAVVDTVFLWGHSLGGTICLDYALHDPRHLQGLILSAPALDHVGISVWKLLLGQLLSRIWPKFKLRVGIDHTASSRDGAVIVDYATDPLRHEYGTARLATEFFQTVHWIHQTIDRLAVPLLLLQGGADSVTDPTSSRALFQQVPTTDKTYRHYPDSYHDLYADLNYMEVIADIADWLAQHGLRSQPISIPLQCLTLATPL
jgi:alpha-beta hydrolase superfamily lysophospholipase